MALFTPRIFFKDALLARTANALSGFIDAFVFHLFRKTRDGGATAAVRCFVSVLTFTATRLSRASLCFANGLLEGGDVGASFAQPRKDMAFLNNTQENFETRIEEMPVNMHSYLLNSVMLYDVKLDDD